MSRLQGVNMTSRGAAAEPSRERVTALLLLLIQAFKDKKPVTQDEIVRDLKIDDYTSNSGRKVQAYVGQGPTTRQKFERDKDRIREKGAQIETVMRSDEQTGYWIDPASLYSPPIHFTADERRVVAAAVGFCGFGRSGTFSLFNDGPAGDGGLEYSNYLNPCVRAVTLRRELTFDYVSKARPKPRHVQPLVLDVIDGRNYLIARDIATGVIKGYRLYRMTSMPQVLKDTFTVTEDDLAIAEAWQPAYADIPRPIDVVVTTSASFAELLVREYPTAVTAQKKDGRVEMGISFDSSHAAMRFVLDNIPRVRLTEPKELREELREWLKQVNRGDVPELSDVHFPHQPTSDVLAQTLQLLHAVYAAEDGIRLSELATRFNLTIDHVRQIMGRLATIEPTLGGGINYITYPAHIIKECDDWDNEDEDDSTYRAEFFDQDDEPSAFTWSDLFELNVALREASRLFSDPAIFSAIDKIETEAARFVTMSGAKAEVHLREFHAAVAAHEILKVTYTAANDDEAHERDIEPRDIRVLNGRTYVRAYCHLRQEWRNFRIDRVGSILAKSPGTQDPASDPVANWLTAFSNAGEEVVLVVDSSRRYLFEPLPGARWTSTPDGRHAVAIRINDPHFLESLLLRAGPGATVVSPAYAKAGRDVAKRIIDEL